MSLKITGYEPGKMIIDDKTYTKDLIIYGDTIIENWWRKEGHILICEDLEPLWELLKRKRFAFDALVVGTGYDGLLKLTSTVIEWIELDLWVHQIDFFRTDEAVDKFNELLEEDKKVAGAFHLTC